MGTKSLSEFRDKAGNKDAEIEPLSDQIMNSDEVLHYLQFVLVA